jgi:hypothetical protein
MTEFERALLRMAWTTLRVVFHAHVTCRVLGHDWRYIAIFDPRDRMCARCVRFEVQRVVQ